jgi:transposase
VKASLHAVLGKCGVIPQLGDMFGLGGQRLLDALELPEPYASRVECQRRLLKLLQDEIVDLEIRIHRRLKDDEQYQALLRIRGIGPITAAIFLAEIGDVHRFPSADALACWVGLTPRHDESDLKVRRGHISKQGSRLLRWALIESCQRLREPQIAEVRRRIIARRGKKATNIAKVAAARKLCHVVYYTLRDGQAQCLQPATP